MGILCGLVAGVSNALILVSIKVAVDTIFPTEGAAGLAGDLAKIPEFLRPVGEWLLRQQEAVRASRSGWGTALVIALIPVTMLLRGTFTYLNGYLTSWVSIRVIIDLRIRLFRHLLSLPASFFNRISTGELMARIGEAGQLQSLISQMLVTLIREPITIGSILFLLLSSQPKITLIALSTLPVAFIPFIIYTRKLRHSSRGLLAKYSSLGKVLHESLTGYRVVKAFNLEERMVEEYRETSRASLSHAMRATRASELPGPIMEFIAGLGLSLFLLYMALFSNGRTPGDLLLFALSIFSIYAPLKNLLRLRGQLESAAAVCRLLFDLLDTRSEIVEPAQPKSLNAAGAPVRFEAIRFAYADKPALRDVSLVVPPGKMVALVGASGSGKSTLTNLLLRFHDPQSGAVRIGDIDIRDVRTHDLRNQIAVVTQEVILFNDTIRNNILLGRPGATEEQIVNAARHAHAHEFIVEKSEGYQTVIGERGAQLSGGQRQRIAIARAILKDAPILVLDEATSALDTESERIVQEALDELMVGRTTICVAHRLSTIRNADWIVVLDEGRIVEEGTHAGLMARNGVFRRLSDLQIHEADRKSGG